MSERKFTGSAAVSLHTEGDIKSLREVRCWGGHTKNSQFVTERVSGDFRAHDLARREIRHFEIKSLQGPVINIIRWHGVSNKAAVLLHFKPNRTVGRINTWRNSKTLSEH